ncbi:MAG: hypothetical protein H6737_19385 [Alphaproteobacteria bacterium]|nr:hypothetical protein [Alphaproteobacteria bacterium]
MDGPWYIGIPELSTNVTCIKWTRGARNAMLLVMAKASSRTEHEVADEPPVPAGEVVGGLLAIEATDELALGAAEDYGMDDILPMAEGDDEDGPVFGLSFGSSDPTGAWDISDVHELVVNETRGHFDASDGRNDAMVMEEDFDDDDEVVVAVWEPSTPGGAVRVGAVVRKRTTAVPKQYIPYGLIAAGLTALLLVAVTGIVAVVVIAVVSGPKVEVRPLDPSQIPKVEVERKPIEEKTADEILEEVLGEEGKGE